MSILVTGFMFLAALALVGAALRVRWLAVSALSLLLGFSSYFTLGIWIARMKGAGRFYSFPFGGYNTSREFALLASLVLWVAAWGAGVYLLSRIRRKQPAHAASVPHVRGRPALRLFLCVTPLGLTPLWGYLIAEGVLNFGGGEKDLLLLIPWILWSLCFAAAFTVYWARKAAIKTGLARSALLATGIVLVVWLMMFVVSAEIVGMRGM